MKNKLITASIMLSSILLSSNIEASGGLEGPDFEKPNSQKMKGEEVQKKDENILEFQKLQNIIKNQIAAGKKSLDQIKAAADELEEDNYQIKLYTVAPKKYKFGDISKGVYKTFKKLVTDK